ncbi:hypothetical protein, partial [Escherichia coli]|uniref:hypothetical protein n=1 Tax=Escherichia coli TaxID=562 RepID=UPI0022431402
KTILKSKVVVPNEENDDHLSKRKNKRRNPGFKPENNDSTGANERRRENNEKKRRPEEGRRPQYRYDNYHDLVMSIADVYHEISDKNLLRRPEPMRSNPAKRNQNKYCRYHGDHGHTTADCID